MPGVTLEVRELSKWFGSRTAVDSVSFTVHEGEVVGLLGPNGAGKTTTIRMLSTVLTPTGGDFAVAGVPSSRPADIRARIGVLPESAGYPLHQTGLEYLMYHGRLFGLARDEARQTAVRLLGQVGLADRAQTRIATYSRGMRQRLGIARALVNNPSVVFLDEPTLGLDPAGQREILTLVRTIAEARGTTVVVSTHTLPEVEQACSSVLIMNRGKVVVSGSVAEVTNAEAAGRQSGHLRVPPDQVARASEVLQRVPGVSVEVSKDVVTVTSADGMNTVLSAVLDAGITLLSFEVDGARLSDAFLAMTRGGSS
ncbi:ABC-2 type transport system ATP-binding protein [Lentzea waywayandensis]|uniref:ABC-2 type transport system ATP-binding protein n=1 Tax=Lentzea waywayandensis TaxID=84724 RepID=A0A1I6FCY8_9PSEU|nr:ABC transporter ATP-binding protein [Lentzea waywayandensis]SFR27845.1 ABC-2 type transport system ATP-binding protein [Lentzea waywayandensis]